MRAFLVSLFVATILQAAPVPKAIDRDKIEAKFGKIVDPRGDTDFKMDGDTLVVTLPGKVEKDAFMLGGNGTSGDWRFVVLTCPLIKLGEVKGDFEVAYSVTTLLSPDAKPIKEKGSKINIGAGLCADFGAKGKLIVTMQSRRDLPTEKARGHCIDVISGIDAGVSGRFQLKPTLSTTKEVAELGKWKVRQVFKEGMFKLHYTPPQDEEREGTSFSCSDATPMKLSLVFFHSSNTKHEVRIDDFKITPIEKK